jgi:NDP-sugar pyrophosphorylase family protein
VPLKKVGLGLLLKDAIRKNNVTGAVMAQPWFNVGTETDLKAARLFASRIDHLPAD